MSELTLGQKQRLFVRLLSRLIDFAYSSGYELTIGDGYRDPRVHGAMGVKIGYSHPSSNHKQRLALSLIHISEPTRRHHVSRMPSSA